MKKIIKILAVIASASVLAGCVIDETENYQSDYYSSGGYMGYPTSSYSSPHRHRRHRSTPDGYYSSGSGSGYGSGYANPPAPSGYRSSVTGTGYGNSIAGYQSSISASAPSGYSSSIANSSSEYSSSSSAASGYGSSVSSNARSSRASTAIGYSSSVTR